jgi:glycosyltransferase involved in cell wall biosynthesis
MKILTFGTLYPDSTRPYHGIFVEHRLLNLIARGGTEARVVAPVPYFPAASLFSAEYRKSLGVPRSEVRSGVEVLHPRFLNVPKIGMNRQPRALAEAAEPVLRRMIAGGFDFDLIDAQYFYPDGVAAIALGAAFHKPVVITARGTDVNLIPSYPKPRKMIQDAAARAAAIVTVCQALKDALVALGVEAGRITVLRNGVDLEAFQPVDRDEARRALGFTRDTLLAVGHLIPRKGVDLAIRALAALPGFELAIVGSGPEEGRLRAFAAATGVADRVKFAGRIAQAELKTWYSAADALVLASDREGWANVLLESMACGTPVIASPIWGNPEVVTSREAGVLMRDRSAEALVEAARALFAAHHDRAATRRYAERFSWDDTSRGLRALFEGVLKDRPVRE